MSLNNDWNVGRQKSPSLSQRENEKAIVVGVELPFQTTQETEEHLDELEFLALTAGAECVKRFTQKRERPHPATFIGKGKIEEVALYIEKHNIDLAIFDDDLSPSQSNQLEKAFKIKIIDRSSLILDIFARRAQTAQAKTQVELAQMQYLLPRLRGLWTHLERQRGGIGMRGPGEQEIETDRRIVRDKIAKLKERLAKFDKQGRTRRKNRGQLIRVSLVGYTNAGKSTLMNTLGKAEVFAENKLFATLDTTTRKVVLEQTPFLLSDTVGFIRKLPHHLIESFKSTLDEVAESDLLLHVVDVSHDYFEDHIQTVHKTLRQLECQDIPQFLVFNKMDAFRQNYFDEMLDQETKTELEQEFRERMTQKYEEEQFFISALSKENMPHFREQLLHKIKELYKIRYPYISQAW